MVECSILRGVGRTDDGGWYGQPPRTALPAVEAAAHPTSSARTSS
jgi:hypothetical protein